jgi:hypothetical protein
MKHFMYRVVASGFALFAGFVNTVSAQQPPLVITGVTTPDGVTMFQADDGEPQIFRVERGSGFVVGQEGAVQLKPAPNGDGAIRISKGSVDIEQVRKMAAQRSIDTMKESMNCSDAEWSVIWTKLETVLRLRSVLGESTNGLMIAIKSPSTVNPTAPANALIEDIRTRQQALGQASAAKASDGELRQLIASLKEARQRARTELAKARAELTGVLTTSQEASLVERGILE